MLTLKLGSEEGLASRYHRCSWMLRFRTDRDVHWGPVVGVGGGGVFGAGGGKKILTCVSGGKTGVRAGLRVRLRRRMTEATSTQFSSVHKKRINPKLPHMG